MAMDPVNPKALKGKFKDREDKDIDNDGDTDSSDEYLHKRRSAVSKAIKNVKEAKLTPDQMRKALDDDKAKAKSKDKVSLKKAPWEKNEEVELDEGYRIHATSKDGEKMKSGIHSTAKDAQDMHYKMAKSGMYKKIEVVKESLEAVELDEAVPGLGQHPALKKAGIKHKWYQSVFKRSKTSVVVHDRDYQKAVKALGDEAAVAGGSVMVDGDKDFKESVVSKVLDRISEAKDNYTINHKTFSSAVQHALAQVEKQGYTVDDDEWDRKVAMGPKKPGTGKTNRYTIDLMNGGKETRRKLQMQVYYDEGRYELNMYIS
jgi:hypothetical protein